MLNHPDLLDVVDSVALKAVSPVHCKRLKFNYCVAAIPYESIIFIRIVWINAYVH